MTRAGEAVALDALQAAKWYRLAAEQGDSSAQLVLAKLYLNGEGLPENYIQVHKWSNLAASVGEDGAAKLRQLVAEIMTREQIAKAQRLAREWKPKTWDELKEGLDAKIP